MSTAYNLRVCLGGLHMYGYLGSDGKQAPVVPAGTAWKWDGYEVVPLTEPITTATNGDLIPAYTIEEYAHTSAQNLWIQAAAFGAALVLAAGVSVGASASPLTATETNLTEAMDHGLSDGFTAAQFCAAYAPEAADVTEKPYSITWSGSCRLMSMVAIAVRQRVPGE